MRSCRNCKKFIPDDARFCPYCGKPQIEEKLVCPACGEENDLDTGVCTRCGFLFFVEKKEKQRAQAEELFDTTFELKLEQEIADKFSLAFEKRLQEEHNPSRRDDYIDRFYKTDFRSNVDFRIQQLAEDVRRIQDHSPHPKKEKAALLAKAFDGLIDYFIIQYCADLNETKFPEAILKYQGIPTDKINLGQLVADYLNFANEDETVYTDFVVMPAQKLRNAAQSFLFPKKGETIFFICDLSVIGNCKEGFAMTSECIYWKAPMEPPQRVYYKNLESIVRQEDWININGITFIAGKSLSLKLLRLLKKLKELFGK